MSGSHDLLQLVPYADFQYEGFLLKILGIDMVAELFSNLSQHLQKRNLREKRHHKVPGRYQHYRSMFFSFESLLISVCLKKQNCSNVRFPISRYFYGNYLVTINSTFHLNVTFHVCKQLVSQNLFDKTNQQTKTKKGSITLF